ncbi:uncharacterized protein LOC109142318 [Scomber scombrus]|uniref:Uncharacterized protein LOC109142318 n=1 Tax=Scomber scombrus TaxID=13677 RepID=A0AAV1Q179_SCOSC
MTSPSTQTGGEKPQVVSNLAPSAGKANASPTHADNIPQWAQDMMSEIKKGNVEIMKYREETKTEIARCKEEIEKEEKRRKPKWKNGLRVWRRLVKPSLSCYAGSLITNMETRLKEMEKEMLKLKGWREDLEARSQRNNIRVVGVREGAQAGKKPSDFMSGLLKEKLGLAVTPTLDRAHLFTAFVVRCHYYTDKRDPHIHTQEVNSKRVAFREARSLCRPARGSDMGCNTW